MLAKLLMIPTAVNIFWPLPLSAAELQDVSNVTTKEVAIRHAAITCKKITRLIESRHRG